jgi:hypothetical protein
MHDAHSDDRSCAFARSWLEAADFRHTPVGVFRRAEQRPTPAGRAGQLLAGQSRVTRHSPSGAEPPSPLT